MFEALSVEYSRTCSAKVEKEVRVWDVRVGGEGVKM